MFPRAAHAPDADAGPDDISALARQHAAAAVNVLIAALMDPDVGTRIAAASRLLDLGHGHAVQPIAIDASGLTVAVHGLREPPHPNGQDEGDSWTPFHERDG
jgi:hypothetical protein